ncbi:BatA domain-containing protein [Planctomycetales bacterium 10988]|nr:BatA domain-containing protein [Planctomycetales bacterium 10988]
MQQLLNPYLLPGLLLAAIPVILHLIMRQKPKRLEFPALRFLQQKKQVNSRRLKIRHWLLLLLRVLAVCLMVMALTRPRTNASLGPIGDQYAPIAAAFVFDTSPRMAYQKENETRLEASQEKARWLLKQMPSESHIAVLDSSLGPAQFQIDLGSARQRVDRLEITPNAQSLSVSIETALNVLSEADPQLRQELYVYTDLTEMAWSPSVISKVNQLLEESPQVSVYFLDQGVEDVRNVSLDPITLSSEVLTENSPLRLQTRLASTSGSSQQTVELLLDQTDGTSVKRDTRTVTVSPSSPQVLEFALAGLPEGIHQGRIQIGKRDNLPFDNERFFTIDIRPAWKILLVSESEEEAVFLQEALAPEELRRRKQARFSIERIDFSELENTNLDRSWAAVCLLDPQGLSDAAWNSLHNYAQQGGGVAFFMGKRARNGLASFHSEVAQTVFPAKLARLGRADRLGTSLAPDPFSHPLLREFRDLEGKVPWEFLPVYRYWVLEELPLDVRTVIPFQNTLPALIERQVGQGRVLLMTTPVSEVPSSQGAWNELVLEWPFVVLSDQMMLYLAGTLKGRLNYLEGQSVLLSLPEKHPPLTFVISSPSGNATRVSSKANEKELFLIPSQAPVAANYQVRSSSTGEQKLLSLGFSVNVPDTMSQLSRTNPEVLQETMGEDRVQIVRDQEEIVRAIGRGRTGQELMGLFAILLAFALGAEYILANRFYRTD